MERVIEIKPTKLTESSVGFIFKLGRVREKSTVLCSGKGQHVSCIVCLQNHALHGHCVVILCEGS